MNPTTPADVLKERYSGNFDTTIDDFKSARDLAVSGLLTELENGTLEPGDIITVQNLIHTVDELYDGGFNAISKLLDAKTDIEKLPQTVKDFMANLKPYNPR